MINHQLIESMAERFDMVISSIKTDWEKPNKKSIAKISKELGFEVPESMRYFAQCSKKYGSWLAGLGQDYEDESHIIQINQYNRNRTECEKMPPNYLIINLGFDDDFDCVDLSKRNADSGEYEIVYWNSVRIKLGYPDWKSFPEYIETHIKNWESIMEKYRNKHRFK